MEDRAMAVEITEIYKLMEGLPPGSWVAISTDRHQVLCFGEDSKAVYDEAKRKGEEIPFIGRVPEVNAQMFY